MSSSEKLTASLAPGGAHHELGRMTGHWEGITRTWFEPDKLADESQTRGTIRAVLGGRFIIHEYEGTLCGEIMQGVAIYGLNVLTNCYEAAWIDNCHNGTSIMFSRAAGPAPGFTANGTYPDGVGGPDWGWRTELSLVHPDQLVITHYNITPDGQEAIGVETVYKRTTAGG